MILVNAKVTKTFVGILLLASVVWASGEPWRTKPYKDWDAQDLGEILSDSPWARPLRVVPTWKGEEDSNLQSQPLFNRNPLSAIRGKRTEDKTLIEDFRGVMFFIVWNSAQTVRQAYLRASFLRGEITEERMAEMLATEPTDYEISVTGQDMTPFSLVDDAELKENAELVASKAKVKLSPSRLRFRRNMEGTEVHEVIFVFPKKTPDGKAFLDPVDQSVDFSCKVGKNILRARFDLPKMVGAKGLDF